MKGSASGLQAFKTAYEASLGIRMGAVKLLSRTAWSRRRHWRVVFGLASPGGQTHVCPLLVSADLRTSAASRLRRPCCILVSVEKVWRFGFYLWLSTAQLLRGLRRRSPNTLSLDMSLIRKLLPCKRRLKKPRKCLSRFTVSLVQSDWVS